MQEKEFLFDIAYLSKVIDDKKSRFAGMEVLDLIYDQFFFTAITVGCKPTTSQYFQPRALKTLALAAAAIHCVLSEYARGMNATVMISQNQYQGTLCPFPVINFTPDATAFIIIHTSVGCLIPPLQHDSARIGAPESLSVLYSLDWHSVISFRIQFLLFQRPSPGIGAPSSPLSRLAFLYFIPHSIPPYSTLLSWGWDLFNSHKCTSVWIVAPTSNSALLTPPFECYYIPVSAPQPRFGTLFHSALLQHLLSTPLFYIALPIWHSSFPGGCSPFAS